MHLRGDSPSRAEARSVRPFGCQVWLSFRRLHSRIGCWSSGSCRSTGRAPQGAIKVSLEAVSLEACSSRSRRSRLLVRRLSLRTKGQNHKAGLRKSECDARTWVSSSGSPSSHGSNIPSWCSSTSAVSARSNRRLAPTTTACGSAMAMPAWWPSSMVDVDRRTAGLS
jgi:hypothetical protein